MRSGPRPFEIAGSCCDANNWAEVTIEDQEGHLRNASWAACPNDAAEIPPREDMDRRENRGENHERAHDSRGNTCSEQAASH